MKPSQTAPAPAALSLNLRRYLYFTAATTGGAIMIVEILGAKMLAPYVGTSHFVWTAQIAVTLMALAAGYYAGGKLVDRELRLGRIYWAILGAAVYLGLSVLLVKPVANFCLNFDLEIGSLLSSVFLFFAPLALLAMVGPFFVRMLTDSVLNMGANVGRLIAVSTLGSFVGTILIGYVLIPFLPNSVTMYLTSCALLAVAAGYFFGWGRTSTSPAAVTGMVVIGVMIGGLGAAQDRPINTKTWTEAYRANSNFGRLQVLSASNETRRLYLYLDDFLDQDSYDPVVKKSVAGFTYMLHDLARGYNTNIHDVLCLGLGVGIVPMQFAREGAHVDAVEINPAVLPLAEKFFDFDPARVHVTIDDARHFLNGATSKYDAIILDAFVGDSSPSHLFSREAFAAMRRVLRPGGVLVINCFGDLDPGKDFFAASLDKTLRAEFRNVTIHGTGMGLGNMYCAASDGPDMPLHTMPPLTDVIEFCRNDVEHARAITLTTDAAHGIVLTDDYNPVEYYDATNRESLRKQLAQWMTVR
ncbi:MAG TPA: fused MFS/spermidine synthase [Verrucomicrobiae bacterium]|nr:fused MFS/spermidine synthase [Verrucomicrobiae bacterium]